MDQLSKSNIMKRVTGTISIPILTAAVLFVIAIANGRMLFTTQQTVASFFSYTAVVMLTTFALSINLGSGRFDFSIGSIASLSAIISSKLTYSMLQGGNGSAFTMLFIALVVGAILGAISGIIYVLLRIPPIITSLGIALIFEGFSFVLTDGAYIMKEVRNASMTSFSNAWYLSAIIIVVALALIYYIYDCTKFGLNYKALREGQKVAVTTGIKEVPNAIISYLICGALMGVVGFLQATRSTTITGNVLNFGSIGIMFIAFLPMFIGGFIGRYSNDKLGYLLAAISISFLNSTFTLFYDVVNTSTKSIIESLLLVAFLIYLNNEGIIKNMLSFKTKKENETK